MGQLLDKPIVEKETHVGKEGNELEWAVSSMQGWRLEMEDAHICASLKMQTPVRGKPGSWEAHELDERHCLFAVLDGHAGTIAATFVAEHYVPMLERNTSFIAYAKSLQKDEQDESSQLELLQNALVETCLEVDCELLKTVHEATEGDALNISSIQQANEDAGTTMVLVVITPRWVVCANLGDSRAVFASSSCIVEVALSHDHKPDLEEERIRAAGGYVMDGRVCGDLAVSRGLGDFRFKNLNHVASKTKTPNHQVSSIPDFVIQNRNTDKDLFVCCACDGIWDVMTNEECVNFVSSVFEGGESNLGWVCEELLEHCLEKESKDNMTALIIKFPAQTIGNGEGLAETRRLREQSRREEEANEAE